MKSLASMTALSLTIGLLTLAGCSKDPAFSPETAGPPATVDGHDHPTEGPHHGDLIELGQEEYHAEILHGEDAGKVTIYVLNAAATEQVPIDATEVTINVIYDGKAKQFTLTASPDASDPEGESSRFVSTDEELAHCLDDKDAEPRLVISINGKSYRGTIAHDHDHPGDQR